MEAILRLFNAVVITKDKKKKLTEEVLKQTINHGFIISEKVFFNYQKKLPSLLTLIRKEIGLNGISINQSFHKSWDIIKNSSNFELIIHQLLHYITTYGFERIGIYNENTVYIPFEKLKVPAIKGVNGLTLTIIHAYTKQELEEKLFNLLGSGIALKEKTVEDILKAFDDLSIAITADHIGKVKNKEARIRLYDKLALVPKDPIEFLRLVLFKTVGSTLLIKNVDTIKAIRFNIRFNYRGTTKEISKGFTIQELFYKYAINTGYERLAEIFLRFKPIFLAFREDIELRPTINVLRRLADKHHKPLQEDFLNSVTKNIKKRGLSGELDNKLSEVNIFRKIRLANALKYRIEDTERSIMYKIRNGKMFATELTGLKPSTSYKKIFDKVADSIAMDLNKNIAGKKIYIPESIIYAIPSSEKSFVGMMPFGTRLLVSSDIAVGVFWKNQYNERIDLDLSLVSIDGKFGWDARFRNDSRTLLFSGDKTDAAGKGASELFYIPKSIDERFMLNINFFNKDITNKDIVFDFFIAKISPGQMNYMVDPNDILFKTKMTINQQKPQSMICFIDSNPLEPSIYFTGADTGVNKTAKVSSWNKHVINYLKNSNKFTLNFIEVINRTEASFVKTKEEADIDLSPENLEKDSFIKLMTG